MIKKVKLFDVVDYSKNRISSNEVFLENFITTDNILQNKNGITIASKLPPNGNYMPKYEEKDILVSNIRPYLKKIWYANKSGGCSSDVLIFKANKNYNKKFVYYNLFNDDFFIHMMKGAKGTKMPRGDKNQILEYLIPQFDSTTQQKITSVLSSLDSKIELNNRINIELEAMAKTLYDYWFVQFDFPNAKGKPYKTSGGKMIWNEELKREIPEGWEVKKVKHFAITGSGSTPLKSKKEYYENGNIPWINSGEVNNPFIIEAKKFITQEGLDNTSAKLFKKGTLLMAMYGATAGKVSILDIEACTNQAICSINTSKEIHRNYLKLVLEDLYNYLINLSTGSARDNLSQDKIKELNVLIPANEITESFDKVVDSCYKKILALLRENQKLAELRDWLLPMLMNGQVKVADIEDKVELRMVAEPQVAYKKSKVK